MHLLGAAGGYRFQGRLWQIRRDGKLQILELTPQDADRMDALTAQRRDSPMDFADASLIAVAESRNLRRVFTMDSDFYIYRLTDGSVVEVIR